MSNPLAPQAVAQFPRGPGQATDNLTSLASGSARGLGVVDFSSAVRYDADVQAVKIKTGASGVSASGYCSLYLVSSDDNTLWSDGIDPTSTSSQKAKIVTSVLVQSISTAANATTYYFAPFSVVAVLGFMPAYWSIVMDNESGAALDGTAASHAALYREVQFV